MHERQRPARLRADAAGVLVDVLAGHSLDRAIDEHLSSWVGADRALAREIAYGSVRWHRRLQAVIQAMVAKPAGTLDPQVSALLIGGVYQLWQMRIPDHAAVAETVAAVALIERKRQTGFVNALLRRFQREAAALLGATQSDPALAHSHPNWLVEQLRADWGEACDEILTANNTRAPMWLRINPAASDPEAYRERLAALEPPQGAAAHPALRDALKLEKPVPAQSLPGFEAGAVSVQDGAAQLVCDFVAAAPGQRVLDACAAPGGKAVHLLERHAGAIQLTALDESAARIPRLEENLARAGFAATIVCADATRPQSWWDGEPFQRILIDAPCSATGVIRRHPDIKLLRRASDIRPLAGRQRALLDALWPLLAPGGRLIYTTCSVLSAENDAVVNDFLAAHSDSQIAKQLLERNIQALMTPVRHGLQLLPGVADLDGFYFACIVKDPS